MAILGVPLRDRHPSMLYQSSIQGSAGGPPSSVTRPCYNGSMYYEVVPEGKVERLTYQYDDSLFEGQIVMVPLGKRIVPGVVIKKVAQPDFATKKISKILYSTPLPQHLLATIRFIHEYYLAPSGAAVSLILPNGVEKKRRKTEQMFGGAKHPPEFTLATGPVASSSPKFLQAKNSGDPLRTHHPSQLEECLTASKQLLADNTPPTHTNQTDTIPLNPHQKNALEGLQKAASATKLLLGVTGSGKTNIYLKMALNAFKRQLSTILLVPEIALTSQLVQVFHSIFKDKVVVIHSKQTEAERHLIFNALLEAKEPLVVIGARSALFAPLHNLGLIIIDEEHEMSYYQENAPRYSAIRVASFMAGTLKCDCVLGSATPTVADYYVAKKKESLVLLDKKAKAGAIRPNVKIIDFRNRDNFIKNRYFSDQLLKAISNNLEKGQQTLIFHNRRGSAPLTICEHCGHELVCPNCFLPLTLHADTYEMLCHTCDFREKVPSTCPECGNAELIHKGFGTKLLETELKHLFPKARVMRFDADNKKGEGLEAVYEKVRCGEVDILVGTQGLAKGLDLPKLATVGVVQADAGLSLPDFAAEERVFQLLTQVIGRVGRGHLETAEVFIQTFQPEHPVLSFAINEDYAKFADYTLKTRRRGGFPPYKYASKLSMTLKTEALVLKKVREAANKLASDRCLMVSPPMPAFHERNANGYTWEIVVRASSRKVLIEACNGLDKNFRISLDPPSLL